MERCGKSAPVGSRVSDAVNSIRSNTVARDNICSLAKKRKRTATAQRVGDDFVIEIA